MNKNVNAYDSIINSLGLNPADVYGTPGQTKTASANYGYSAPASERDWEVLGRGLEKCAEMGFEGSEEEQLDMVIQMLQELKSKRERGEMLQPDEEEFLSAGERAGLLKMASEGTSGVQDANANHLHHQEGYMADEMKAKDNANNMSGADMKGDDGVGEQNPMSGKNKIQGQGAAAPTSATSEGSNAKTAGLAKIAAAAMENMEIEKIADYIAARYISEIQAAQDAAYREKVAYAQESLQYGNLEGIAMADAFYARYNELTQGQR